MKIRYLYVLIGSMMVLNIFAQKDLPKPVIKKEQTDKHTNAKESPRIPLNTPQSTRSYGSNSYQSQLSAKEMYEIGDKNYRKKNYSEALKWYRKAAEQGNAEAQINLGGMYLYGKGVPQDNSKAVKWFRKAAEQENAMAQKNIGWLYEQGKGVPQDDSEAVKWFRKAAEQGDEEARAYLGWMYEKGRGVLQDNSEAVKWYKKAAEQGNVDTQTNLGSIYEKRKDVQQYDSESVERYRKAAAQRAAQENMIRLVKSL